ncbi:MAG TPA: VOC family protein [Gemmatimonadota bacterium]|jgi:catechol 2,3-dioxygenase-like lactoylglutathione lyase family enzyme
MPRALRLQSVTLPVPDLAAAEKFYRWVLAMKASAEEPVADTASLGWGKEDRVRLVAASGREALELRMEACEPTDVAAWLAERGLEPTRVVAFADDEAELREVWPDVAVTVDPDPAVSNRFGVSIEAPVDVRVDLHVPLPSSTVVVKGRHGPFYRRSKDWSGLENPGLLGLTLGARDPRALEEFLVAIGIEKMAVEPGGGGTAEALQIERPYLVGDHQIRVEEREPPGIYGAAFVVAAPRLPDLVRTLERFEVQHRHDRNHLLAVDPAGRILVVNGVRSG